MRAVLQESICGLFKDRSLACRGPPVCIPHFSRNAPYTLGLQVET